MSERHLPTLERLRETSLSFASPDEDLRGRTVFDRDGEQIGKVDAILIDRSKREVRFLEVVAGQIAGLGGKTQLIPAEAITSIDDEVVQIDRTRDFVSDSPTYDPELVTGRVFDEITGYYGYPPF